MQIRDQENKKQGTFFRLQLKLYVKTQINANFPSSQDTQSLSHEDHVLGRGKQQRKKV